MSIIKPLDHKKITSGIKNCLLPINYYLPYNLSLTMKVKWVCKLSNILD